MSITRLFGLSGKTAIITGASSGLGADMAEILAEAGANIIITSRNIEKAKKKAAEITAGFPGIEALGIELDVTVPEDIERCLRSAASWKGRLDILINNAGGGSGASEGHILKRNPDDIIEMINTNLTGVILCCRVAAIIMAKQRFGKIINIASIAGLVGRDRRMYERSGMNGQPVDYAAAKAGVLGLTRDLAASLCDYGINVNAISPGGFFKGDLPPMFNAEYADETMLKRWGRMGSDIKGAALFLSTEASDYITGQNIIVDGGFSVYK